MENTGKSVLLLESFSRQVLPIATGFSKLGWQVITLNASRLDLGNATRFADRKMIMDRALLEDEAGLFSTVETLLERQKIDLIVPLSDFSANVLARNKDRLKDRTALAVNDLDVFSTAYDKLQTMALCQDNGIPCPITLLSPKTIADIEQLGYPLVVKPRSGCGSIGFHVLNDRAALLDFMKTMQDPFSPMLYQQYIPQTGTQYNVHMFLDEKQDVQTLITAEKVRWFPIDGGASTLCRTIDRPDIAEMCTKLLKKMKWVGYCDVDLILDPRDKVPKIIEVNARISANVKLCYACGVDIAAQLSACYQGQAVPAYQIITKEHRLRCLHMDILWFIKSPARFRTRPSWFDFRHTTDQIFSLTDPLPFFTFSLQSIGKYRSAMKLRKR